MHQQPRPTSTLTHTRSAPWMHALAVLLAIAGGVAAYSFIAYGSRAQYLTLYFLVLALASVIGGLLWRTWGSLLAVSLALWLGVVAADLVSRVLAHVAVNTIWGVEVIFALDMLVLAAIPALLGAAMGTELGRLVVNRDPT